MSNVLQLVKEGKMPIDEALKKIQKHSTRLSEINPNLNSQPLRCGFPNTFERYDYLMSHEGNMVVIAARPGNGKTALACQIGLQVSEHSRVLMFSLEMKKETLMKRMLSVVSEVDIKKLGLASNKAKIEKAKDALARYKFDIIDENDLSIDDIKLRVYDEHRLEPISLVVIDYIGIIKVNQEYRANSIGNAAKTIKKEIADKLRVPVIVLAQMNRGFDGRRYQVGEDDEPRPTLADIGESSGIEHSADVVMFLHRPFLQNPDLYSPNQFKVFVAKNRNGEVKDFELTFSESLTKFFEK